MRELWINLDLIPIGVLEQLGIDEALSALVEGRVDRDDVALNLGSDMSDGAVDGWGAYLGNEVLQILDAPRTNLRSSVYMRG